MATGRKFKGDEVLHISRNDLAELNKSGRVAFGQVWIMVGDERDDFSVGCNSFHEYCERVMKLVGLFLQDSGIEYDTLAAKTNLGQIGIGLSDPFGEDGKRLTDQHSGNRLTG